MQHSGLHVLSSLLWFIDGIRTCIYLFQSIIDFIPVWLFCRARRGQLIYISFPHSVGPQINSVSKRLPLHNSIISFIVQIIVFTVFVILNKNINYRFSDDDIVFMSLRLCAFVSDTTEDF
jgi:hypothetical protein